MAPKLKHRTPVIDAAVTLFRRNGYSATGVNDIVALSEAPKGSLYYHFPGGKPAIAVAAVEEAGRRVCATLYDLAATAPDTAALVSAHAALLAKWMKQSGYRDGCPMTTVLLELAPAERDVARAGREAYAARQGIIENKLQDDGHNPDTAARLARLATSALQGALIEARVQKNGKPLLEVAETLQSVLSV